VGGNVYIGLSMPLHILGRVFGKPSRTAPCPQLRNLRRRDNGPLNWLLVIPIHRPLWRFGAKHNYFIRSSKVFSLNFFDPAIRCFFYLLAGSGTKCAHFT
jgi:hypothetical protein